MARRSGLVSDFLKLLDTHRPISRGRHLNKMTQQSGHVETGETRFCHGACLELGHFFAGPLIAVLFRYPRPIWAFGFFERFFV
jgi:hypothetical protein